MFRPVVEGAKSSDKPVIMFCPMGKLREEKGKIFGEVAFR